MKKLFVISLLVLALLSAQLPANQAAYYSSGNSTPAITPNTWLFVDSSYFTGIGGSHHDGVVSLYNNAFRPVTGYTDLINVSGTCTLAYRPNYFALVLQSGNDFYVLAEVVTRTASFSLAVPVTGDMKISLYQDYLNKNNSARCTILFEAVN